MSLMRSRPLSGFLRRQEASIFVVALLLIAWFESANHDFLLSSASLQNLSQYIAPVAIIACGEIMLMIGGEIDLSAGMVYAFAPFIMHFAADAGVPMFVALLIGLLAAGCIGLLNGVVTLLLSVPSFVTTLGTLFLVNGLTLTISRGTPVTPTASEAFAQVFGAWGYSEILWAILVVIVLHVVLRHTRWGLHTVASGANETGAREAGIRVTRLKIGNFVVAAVLAGFTGYLGSIPHRLDRSAGGRQPDHVPRGGGRRHRRHAAGGRFRHHHRCVDRRGGARRAE